MELKTSSPKLVDLSPPECNSDPEEKEISDDDDDDRNHKHRRRDTRSQSLERDTPDPVFKAPFRNRNKPLLNGNHFRDNDSQASGSWKNHNSNNIGKDFIGKFDKRRIGHASIARSPLDVNQRFRPHQAFLGDLSLARGRGRDLGSWNQHDSRFGSDLGLFPGRGLPNVSNGPNPPWNAFGLIPGIPNGGLDAIHSIGLQGPLRPPIPATLNMGIPLQRCRDFEERGFCLRGDMCPMEHGVNRIVIEDVQSLSQFNLPVSLPSAHLLGPTNGPVPGSVASMNSSSVTAMNSKGIHSKANKPGFSDDGLGLNGSYPGPGAMSGADLYDPDQPLWNNNGPETSNALLGLHSAKIDDTELLANGDTSDNEFPVRSTGNTAGSNTTSVWGRIGSSKARSEAKEKVDPAIGSSDYLESDGKEEKVTSAGIQNSSRQGKRIVTEDAGSKPADSSAKSQFDTMHNNRKPSQKALRTLFVNGIPLKNNKRENLLSHFQKFGEVIDIYIPLNTERAFVQFSKNEEAEAALKSPDAVMGNRFIKLWWANRDSIADDNISSVGAVPHGVAAVSVPPHSSVASRKRENLQPVAPPKTSVVAHTPDGSQLASENSKPVIPNGPKVIVPTPQKKQDSLGQLREELRKKQEMLEQKRLDFKRKLVKLEKQATGSKSDLDTEQVAKRLKSGTTTDVANTTAATPLPSDTAPVAKSPHPDTTPDKNKSGENVVPHSPKANATVVLHEPTSSKQHSVRPFASSGPPFLMNRYKLDNRPTAFRILPPLPSGFANVATVKEHFLPYGEISSAELEDVEPCNDNDESESTSKDCSARVSFVTRRSAERAFVTGKCWQGHILKFVWLTPSTIPSSDLSVRETSPTTCKGSSDTNVKPEDKLVPISSEEVASSEEKRNVDEDVEDSGPSQSPGSGKEESTEEADTC